MTDFQIDGADGGEQTGGNDRVLMSLVPDGAAARMRKRTGLKWPGGRRSTWLYGELDGVRCYVREEGEKVHIIMTKRDLYP